MSTPFPYENSPHVTVRRVQDGGATYRQIVLTCAVPGCNCRWHKRGPGKPLPVEALSRMARCAGWSGDFKRGTPYCPDHNALVS